MAKLAIKSTKKRVKVPVKLNLPSGYSTGTRIGTKPIKNTPPKRYNMRGGGASINFGLPAFGQANTPLPGNQTGMIFNPVNPFNSQEVVQYNKDHHIGDREGLFNPFQAVNDLATKLSDPTTWFQVVGFIVAVLLILVSLYGIVNSGQKSLASSVLGQNTSGFVKAVRGKNAKK